MKLIKEEKYNNIIAKLYEYKLGYGYKVFTKLKGKTTCVAQSYCYYFDKAECLNKMNKDIENIEYLKSNNMV